jgi:hypothetical protein
MSANTDFYSVMMLESFANQSQIYYHRDDGEFQGFVFNNFHINVTLCIQHNWKLVYIQEELEQRNPYVLCCQQLNTSSYVHFTRIHSF